VVPSVSDVTVNGLVLPVAVFDTLPDTHLAVYDVADDTVLNAMVAFVSPAFPVTPVGAVKVAANTGQTPIIKQRAMKPER
jgi:hypothetical protein